MDSQAYNSQFWWQQAEGKALANSVFSYIKRLNTEQSYIQDGNFRNMRLYGNYEAFALKNYSFYRAEPTAAVQNRVTLNIIQSMVDTAVSKLAKNKPKPTFLTDGGDWSLQRKAMKLSQFVEGQFQATNFYAKRSLALQGSGIFGTGALKIFREGQRIKVEQIFIDELMVDDTEAIYGEPRQMHQRKYIHKDVLCSMFPDSRAEIEAFGSPNLSEQYSNSFTKQTNMILVVESWRLPSAPGAGDGLHTICIENCELFREKWTRDYFPFVFWRWTVPPMGFWGKGLAEQLTGIQLEINKILRTIQVSMHLVSVPKVLVEASAKIVSSHLNNKIGGIIKYAGNKPDFANLGTIPPELFAHLDRLYTRAYEIAGISQLSAQSQKPAGLDSGKAIREYNDIESERFMSVGQRDEEAVIQVSRIMLDEAKAIHAEFGEYSVKVSTGSTLDTIAWEDVSMEEDQYVMRVFPTSALSSTPSGKLQDVKDLIDLGFIEQADAMKLLDFPDLKQFYNMSNAGIADIERAIELMIDKGDYQTPEPYQNLMLGIQKMQQAYLMYRAQGAPEEKLELFRRWMEDASALMKKSQQASEPPPESAGMPESLPPEMPLDPAVAGVPLPPDPNAVVPAALPPGAPLPQ